MQMLHGAEITEQPARAVPTTVTGHHHSGHVELCAVKRFWEMPFTIHGFDLKLPTIQYSLHGTAKDENGLRMETQSLQCYSLVL